QLTSDTSGGASNVLLQCGSSCFRYETVHTKAKLSALNTPNTCCGSAGGAREPLQPVQLSSLNHELTLPENFHPTPPCAEPQLHGSGSCATVAPEVPRRYPGLTKG